MSSSLPDSYSTLPFQQIRVSHIPESSITPTKVILITLYRPGKHNAFTDAMTQDLETAFNLLSLDARVNCIILTGYGKMFCAGADLEAGLSYENETSLIHRDGGGRVALAIHRCTKPTISAINGSAVGVGITMTLPTSIHIVSSTAKIGFVFARRGIIMEACSSYFFPRRIGLSRAMHLTTTGSIYPSTSPLLSTLFSEILPPEQVLPRALELASDVAKNTNFVGVVLAKDKKEGIQSFIEKRDPEFKGNMQENAQSVWPWWKPADTDPPPTAEELMQRFEEKKMSEVGKAKL
ncbi:hypothetical protein DID88_000572 [Monilinia fructigena]|uniref:Enoyl-CoA hydratase n=1 Tax=Monilinia fructigena TaxID=38457 RepID=A0A395IIE5_9HELO|nr:hypothetical protein DID88_000572 [Monilinia fructigena]